MEQSREPRSQRWRGGCARTAGTRTRTPALARLAPTRARPAAARTHRVPLSPMVRGRRGEVRGVSAQAGKSPADRRGAGQPVPGSCSASSALRAAAPARSRRAAQHPPRPGRGAGEPGSPAPERGGPAGPVCACVRAAQPAAGQGSGASGPGGRHSRSTRVLPRVCVCVYVRAHAGRVYVRVCEREGAGACAPLCALPSEVRLPGWSGVLVFVQCACVQARFPAHAGGGWGAAFACAGAWTPKVRLQPQGGAPGGSPGRVGGRWETGCLRWRSPYAPPYPHHTSPPFWSENTLPHHRDRKKGRRGLEQAVSAVGN